MSGKRIIQGIQDAIDFAKGDHSKATLHPAMTDSKMPEPVAWIVPGYGVTESRDFAEKSVAMSGDPVTPLYARPAPVADAELEALVAQARTGIQTKTMMMHEGETVDLVATFNLQMRLADAIEALRTRTAQPETTSGHKERLFLQQEFYKKGFNEAIRCGRAKDSGEWQPIESAPKDRIMDIWAVDNGGTGRRVTSCYYDHICDEWRTSAPALRLHCVKARYVTHWMYPPNAPALLPEGDA